MMHSSASPHCCFQIQFRSCMTTPATLGSETCGSRAFSTQDWSQGEELSCSLRRTFLEPYFVSAHCDEEVLLSLQGKLGATTRLTQANVLLGGAGNLPQTHLQVGRVGCLHFTLLSLVGRQVYWPPLLVVVVGEREPRSRRAYCQYLF